MQILPVLLLLVTPTLSLASEEHSLKEHQTNTKDIVDILERCSICLDPLYTKDAHWHNIPFTLTCDIGFHSFHMQCLESAIHQNRACPECRQKPTDNEVKLLLKLPFFYGQYDKAKHTFEYERHPVHCTHLILKQRIRQVEQLQQQLTHSYAIITSGNQQGLLGSLKQKEDDRVSQLRKKVRSQREQIKRLKREHDTLESQHDTLKKQCLMSLEKQRGLERQHTIKYNALQSQLSHVLQEKQASERQHQNLQTKYTTLEQSHKDLQKAHTALLREHKVTIIVGASAVAAGLLALTWYNKR